MVNNQNIPVTNKKQQNILERNHLKYSKSKKRQNKQNSHIHVKTQQIIISHAFKIIIHDNNNDLIVHFSKNRFFATSGIPKTFAWNKVLCIPRRKKTYFGELFRFSARG